MPTTAHYVILSTFLPHKKVAKNAITRNIIVWVYTEFCLKNISVEIELGTTFYYIKNIMMDEFGMTIYIELEDIIDHPYSEDFDI